MMMTTQQELLTQHMMMTTREVWSTHHTIRTWQWTAQLRSLLRKRSFNFLPSVWATGRPSLREPWQPQVLGRRLRRWSNLPYGLPGPVNPRSPSLPACLWWDGPADGSERHRSRSGYHRQRVTSQLSRVPQQGTLQLQDRIQLSYLMSAVCSARQWPKPATRIAEAATSSKTSKATDSDFPDSMWRSPARLIHPDHHCSHSHEHGRRDRHRGSARRYDPGCVTRQQDSAERAKHLPCLCLRLWRVILPAGLPGPVTEVAQFHPASLWWEDLGLTAAQCLPGTMDLKAIDHAVVNGVAEIEVTGLREVTNHQGSITRLGIERVGSGPGPSLPREGPAPGPSRLMWWMSGCLLPLIISIITIPVLCISGMGWSYLV